MNVKAWMLCFALCLALAAAPAQAQRVDLGDRAVTDVDALCAYLDDHPEIDALDMYASRLTREEMALLDARYPQIRFGWTLTCGDHTVRTDATAFSALHSKRSEPHTSEDFEVLRYCRDLLALDLGHNDIDDISFLEDLQQLRVLILGRNQIEDISPLAALTQLQYLELFSNRVKDVSALGGLAELVDLNIANNPIETVEPLKGLLKLERLWCGMNANLTRFGLLTLRDAVGGLEIDNESHPTGGTWREHPRYEVIARMFETGVYIPFEE